MTEQDSGQGSRQPSLAVESLRESDLLLVSMPFGPQVFQPSLALSLLKAEVKPLKVSTKVLYLTLRFAEQVGHRLYGNVSSNEPTTHGFVGEWIFSGALFPERREEIDNYVDDILRGRSPDYLEARANLKPIADKEIEELLDLRRRAVPFVEQCLEEVLAHRPKIVGFTSTFQQQLGALSLARRIKQESPETFVVFGGANCEGVMGVEVLRQFGFVDAVVSGEADLVFPQLVERVLSGDRHDNLQGVNTRSNSGFSALRGAQFTSAPMVQDMDALPYADYDDFYAQYEAANLGVNKERVLPRLMFETSRGCWWGAKAHCTFCGLNGGTMAFRAKSEQRALDEILYLHERFPGSGVSVTDNILDMKYFKHFVPELAAKKIELELFYEVKANLRKDQIRLLHDAGITLIQPGIESFSDSVLELMRKGIKGLQNVQLLKWCKELGVVPGWNLLWGFPGESPAEYERMAELLPLLYHLPPAGGYGVIRLDRFSPNFDRAEEFGFTDVSPYPAYKHLYPFAPEVLANLAYFFTFRYKTPRDVQGYTAPIRELLAEWKEAYDTSDLFLVDKGTQLLIWDLRPQAETPLTVLNGVLRKVYLACDGVCPENRLAELLAAEVGRELTPAEVSELLAPLLERGLMLRDGHSFLALAIPLGEYSPEPKVVARLQEIIKGLGESAGGTSTIKLPALGNRQPDAVMTSA